MKFLLIAIMTLGSFLAQAKDNRKAANDETVTQAVLTAFNGAFRNAADVNWEESREFYKARFVLNAQHIYAFYSKDGKLLATARNLLFTDLPVILQTSMKDLSAGGYWISDLFELSNDEGTTYYLTLENADNRIIMQSCRNGWEQYQKKSK